jgi:hypothetical protein
MKRGQVLGKPKHQRVPVTWPDFVKARSTDLEKRARSCRYMSQACEGTLSLRFPDVFDCVLALQSKRTDSPRDALERLKKHHRQLELRI